MWIQFCLFCNNVCVSVNFFLAYLISISEILAWDCKFYPTQVILPRLSHVHCLLVVLELTDMVVK